MRTILLVLALAFAPAFQTGCQTAPTQRTQVVTTLKVLGASAKAGMDAATDLLKRGQITVTQWQRVALFYDTRWQPAFSVAVGAARADLSTLASPDLIALATDFANLVSQLTTPPTK
jgi:hypothetical protein